MSDPVDDIDIEILDLKEFLSNKIFSLCLKERKKKKNGDDNQIVKFIDFLLKNFNIHLTKSSSSLPRVGVNAGKKRVGNFDEINGVDTLGDGEGVRRLGVKMRRNQMTQIIDNWLAAWSFRP